MGGMVFKFNYNQIEASIEDFSIDNRGFDMLKMNNLVSFSDLLKAGKSKLVNEFNIDRQMISEISRIIKIYSAVLGFAFDSEISDSTDFTKDDIDISVFNLPEIMTNVLKKNNVLTANDIDDLINNRYKYCYFLNDDQKLILYNSYRNFNKDFYKLVAEKIIIKSTDLAETSLVSKDSNNQSKPKNNFVNYINNSERSVETSDVNDTTIEKGNKEEVIYEKADFKYDDLNLDYIDIKNSQLSDETIEVLREYGINTLKDLLSNTLVDVSQKFNCLSYEQRKEVKQFIIKWNCNKVPSSFNNFVKYYYPIIEENIHILKEEENLEENNLEESAISYNEDSVESLNAESSEDNLNEDNIGIAIDKIGLSNRAINALKKSNINTVNELIKLTEEELYSKRNLGKKTVEEILAKIAKIKTNDEEFNNNIEENIAISIDIKDVLIDVLDLSYRSYHALDCNGISTLGKLGENIDSLEKIRNLGMKSIFEIKNKFYNYLKEINYDFDKNEIIQECNSNYLSDYVSILLLINPNIDIDVKAINLLINQKISLCDIYVLGPKILFENGIKNKDSATICCGVKYLFDNNLTSRNLYELAYKSNKIIRNLCSDECIRLLKDNLDNINPSNKAILSYNYNLTHDIYSEGQYDINDSLIIKYLRSLSFGEEIELDELKSHFENIEDETIDVSIEKLAKNNLIKFDGEFVSYNYILLHDYIHDIFDGKSSYIVTKMLAGSTLESVGTDLGLTKERVRQIFNKDLRYYENSKIFDIFEDRFKNFYTKYDWSKDIFCYTFSCEESELKYLTKLYNKGEKDIRTILEDDVLNDDFKTRFLEINNMVMFGDTSITNSRVGIIDYLIETYAQKSVSISYLAKLYYDFAKDEEKFDERYGDCENNDFLRIVEGLVKRNKSCIQGLYHSVRYFNYSLVSDSDVNELSALIMNLEKGYYSTDYIYRSNLDLMDRLNINDKYELHNFIRRSLLDRLPSNIILSKMPHFLVEYSSSRRFILDKIKLLSPIKIDDFLDIFYEDYGLNKDSFKSLLSTDEYFKYIRNNQVVFNSDIITSDEINAIQPLLEYNMYSIETFDRIAKKVCPRFDVNNSNLAPLGYRLRKGNYIIRSEFSSILDYIKYVSDNFDFFSVKDLSLFSNINLYNSINKAKTLNLIFTVSRDKFITLKKLENLGISLDYINEFKNEVFNKFVEEDYFTLNNLYEEFSDNLFTDFGFEDEFFIDLLYSVHDISMTTWCNQYVFSFGHSALAKTMITEIVDEYSVIGLYELQGLLEDKYGLIVEVDKLKEKINETELFYSSALEKIYSDKQFYYDELYDEGE